MWIEDVALSGLVGHIVAFRALPATGNASRLISSFVVCSASFSRSVSNVKKITLVLDNKKDVPAV